MAKVLKLNKQFVSKYNLDLSKKITVSSLKKNNYTQTYHEYFEETFDFEGYKYLTSMCKGFGAADNIKCGEWVPQYFVTFDIFTNIETGKKCVALSPIMNAITISSCEDDSFVLRSFESTTIDEIEKLATRKFKFFSKNNCTTICKKCNMRMENGIVPECYDKYLDNTVESRIKSENLSAGKIVKEFECEKYDMNSFIKFGSAFICEDSVVDDGVYTFYLNDPFNYISKHEIFLEDISLTELCEIISKFYDKAYSEAFIYENNNVPFENLRLNKIFVHEKNIITCKMHY